MKSLTSWFVLIVSIAVIVSSCAKSDDSKTASTDNTNSSSDDSSNNSTSTAELEGTWVTSCNTTSWNNNHYVIETITVSGSGLVWKWDEHSDSSCSNDYIIWTDNHSSLSLGNEVTLDNGSKATKFTMKVESLEALMKTSAAATDYNNYVWCGDSDWALNTSKDYSGKTCSGETYPAKNATISGVYKLDGSSLLINTDNITSVGSTVFTKVNLSSSSSSSSGSGVFVAVGGAPRGSLASIVRSTDNGSSFDNATQNSAAEHLNAVTFGNNTFVAIGQANASGQLDPILRSTDNGSSWDNVTSPNTNGLHGVTFGNNTFVVVGADGNILRSTDNGSSWDNATSPTTYGLEGVTFGNNTFVAVGDDGGIVRSTDNGSSWDNATSPTTNHLYGATFGNNTFVAVGSSGNIVRSTDNGSSWDNATSPTAKNLYAVPSYE